MLWERIKKRLHSRREEEQGKKVLKVMGVIALILVFLMFMLYSYWT